MIQVEHLRKSFGEDVILADVSFGLRPGERAALIGRNGTGKSTILKVLCGQLEADSGQISAPRGTVIAYLPQDAVYGSTRPLRDEVRTVFGEVLAIETRQRELELLMAAAEPDEARLHAIIEEHHALQTEFERKDGYTIDARIGTVLAGLGFRPDDGERPVEHFSGGWQMRVALAKLLLQDADLLLLDEPTNHLDLAAVEWLEEYLQRYRGAVVIVSHDRYFLDRATTRTLELENGTVTDYAGAYSWYVAERERRLEEQQAAYERQQQYLTQQSAFIEKFRASATRSSQAKSREKLVARVERVERVRHAPEMAFRLNQCPPSGREVLTVRGVSRAYGERQVLAGIELLVERGDKVALVGPNGAGKSTLLRLLARMERPDRGNVLYGEAVEPSYFAQQQAEALTPTNTVLDEVYGAARYGTTVTQVRTLLGRLLFRQDDVFKRVADLSGGERSRVALAKMLLRPANLLLLDEPTNHLDVAAKETIEEALNEFAGTVVIASHDRYFLDQFVNKTVEVSDTRIRVYPGNYTYYRERKSLEAVAQAAAPKPAGPTSVKAEPRQQSSRKPRVSDSERELAQLEQRIAGFEARQKVLSEELASPETYAGGRDPSALLVEYEAISARLVDLHERWEALVSAM